MNHAEIYRIALAAGFKLKLQPDRTMDLNPYVYRFAEALLEQDGNQWKAAHDDLAEQVERLGEVLERSMNGLEWYRESHPGSWSEADDEHLEECRKALEKVAGTSLARRDAEVARSIHVALCEGADHNNLHKAPTAGRAVDFLLSLARQEVEKREPLRRQAEEAPSC